MAHPLLTLENNDTALEAIVELVQAHDVQRVIVGLPRGMNGQDTDQTKYTEEFVEQLEVKLGMSVVRQDEALTSQKAEAELTARKKPFAKAEVDALAATYILEDYISEHVGASYV
jgi:putative Holliday junction resolvase